ncbi:hypothetical protein [Fibrivirga algicola]|uniref:HEPN AbiU2-like domain-containing protein n=1 Tax=Fibrivirga algicola TaxID=2950420 RepID=A0ABX0QLP5_9BACT|nr:hypothetical protein [Fibrivirga algicola]NID13374.1 hypothetical protein [Fibrivirga algicola]
MSDQDKIGKIEASLDLLHSFLVRAGTFQKFHHFFAVYSIILVVILDTLYHLDYWTEGKSKYEKVLVCRSLSVIIVTFLEESKGYFGLNYQAEMRSNNLIEEAKLLGSHNSQLKRFRTQNINYFKAIRNKTMAHRGDGILTALSEINQISDEEFIEKTVELLRILNSHFDELDKTAKSILTIIEQRV